MPSAILTRRPPRSPALARFTPALRCPTIHPGPQPLSSFFFHTGHPKTAAGIALQGVSYAVLKPRWPSWFRIKPLLSLAGTQQNPLAATWSLCRSIHMAAKLDHVEISLDKSSWWLPVTGEVLKATECPQDFSAQQHLWSSALLQRLAGGFEFKCWTLIMPAETTVTPEKTPSPPQAFSSSSVYSFLTNVH